ncbi:MAG: class I SAM-dependent methyltransferase [Verrucomicrobia bacterium]|nr:class I SAM-dependent methyltransferase [Verrucomicrobiota bacterium]MBV9644086.1 class I SAM-dependent methyltransferase [Verrucomicrobiota bacterium]
MMFRSLLEKLQVRHDLLTMQPEELVTAAYKALLRREPDPGGLKACSDGIRAGHDLEWLLGTLIRSEEFALNRPPNDFPLDAAPPMDVQANATTQELRALWDHIGLVWTNFGATDPYWSVLTNDRWRAKNMTEEEAIESFYATGQSDLLRLEAWLRRNSLELNADAVCGEYGCGVGRLTQWLSTRFRRVVALDISEPHLKAARERLCRRGIDNVDFILVRGDEDLRVLDGVSLFYSMIVLQHNPPPIMTEILARAFAGLSDGGCCFFQIPTYSASYSFSVKSYWTELAAKKEMEMHFLPQKNVLELARQHEVFPVEIQPDGAIGNQRRWISTTFLMRKSTRAK